MTLFDPRKAAWWNASPERMREAYYMTLRVHYQMPASEAWATLRKNADTLGIGRPMGFIGQIREALAPREEAAVPEVVATEHTPTDRIP